MDRFSHLIVGAGFAGSVCAERLATAGKRVLLIDQRVHVGGNAFDEYDAAGVLVSRYGAHVFHTNSRPVFEYLSQFTDWREYEHRVLSSVNGRLVPVPINRETLAVFGGDEAEARRVLYEPYTRKQWGEYAAQLSPTVLARVKTRDSADPRYFTDAYQAMPVPSYARLFARLLAHQNITIMLKTRYADVVGAGPLRGASIIYTGPIDEFFEYRLGRLPYRSARFVFETHDQPWKQPVGVVNYPSPDVAYTRVTEFKHLTGQRHPQTTVAYEYPCAAGPDAEPFWPVPTEASAQLYRAYQELAKTVPHVHFCGRLGSYKYLDIDQTVAQALKLSAQALTPVS